MLLVLSVTYRRIKFYIPSVIATEISRFVDVLQNLSLRKLHIFGSSFTTQKFRLIY